jgi:3-hydroxyisobutyrate dehydrogenase-like beta-hydroxyacid dehydrogenase
MPERVAVIGLGAMGTPMALRLVEAGFPVAVFDVVPERVQGLVAAGARGGLSPADAVHGCDRVVVMVATPAQLRAALAGADGIAATVPTGAIVIVTGTVGVEAVTEAEAELAPRGVSVLDAAVSGGVRRAGTGELLIMAGGDAGRLERCRTVLAVLGTELVHCGPRVGDGQAVKLVNQLLGGVHLAAAAEALAFATALGLDRELVWQALHRGAAASFMLEHRAPLMLDGRDAAGDRVLPNFLKDLELVAQAAGARKFHPLLATGALELFRRGVALHGGREDDAALVDAYDDAGASSLLQALAQVADLPLGDARATALADGFAVLMAEGDELRAAPPREPHTVFDPRWE